MDFCGRGNEPSGFHKMRGNSRLVEELLALQERLFSLVVSKIVGRPCLMTPYFFFFNITPWIVFGECGHPFHYVSRKTVPEESCVFTGRFRNVCKY